MFEVKNLNTPYFWAARKTHGLMQTKKLRVMFGLELYVIAWTAHMFSEHAF